MGFRPSPAESGSTLIWMKLKSQAGEPDDNVKSLVSSVNQTLANYEPGMQTSENFIDCKNGEPRKPEDKKVCRFNLGDLQACKKETNFGYTAGQPCVLIKLNRIFGWTPEPYASEDELPADVKAALANATPKKTWNRNLIYVTCAGQDNVDKEHMGPIKIYPEGFGFQYYPFRNSPGYLSPLVMVQFLNPSPGVLLNIECKAWAKNIQHSRLERLGQVHFEIKVDR
jgi:sodium/potassium-transporting ATPase subunit beta